jgi:hypothetical protein
MFRRSQRLILAASAACLVSLSGSVYAHDIPGEATQPGSDFTQEPVKASPAAAVLVPAMPAARPAMAMSAAPALPAPAALPAAAAMPAGKSITRGNHDDVPHTVASKSAGWGSEKPGTDSYHTGTHPR